MTLFKNGKTKIDHEKIGLDMYRARNISVDLLVTASYHYRKNSKFLLGLRKINDNLDNARSRMEERLFDDIGAKNHTDSLLNIYYPGSTKLAKEPNLMPKCEINRTRIGNKKSGFSTEEKLVAKKWINEILSTIEEAQKALKIYDNFYDLGDHVKDAKKHLENAEISCLKAIQTM